MFLVLQFPLIDTRGFLHEETHCLPTPQWNLPKPDSDFIRSFGVVKNRLRGGLKDWNGEGVFCDASRALRFEGQISGVQNISNSRKK